MEIEFILRYRSNDPAIGYYLSPRLAKKVYRGVACPQQNGVYRRFEDDARSLIRVAGSMTKREGTP